MSTTPPTPTPQPAPTPLNPAAPSFTPSPPPPLLPFLTNDHFCHTVHRLASSRAGGPSGIPIAVVRAAWPALETRLSSLFRACIRLGHHPRLWRSYLGVVLRKPGKADYAIPKAYRLITLEETMSKVLEGAVEEWLRWKAEVGGALPALQFGGRRGRGVEDAVMWVMEKIQEWRRKGWVVVGLGVDGKAAFPSVRASVLLDILLHRLDKSAHPLLPRLRSFLSDRSVRLTIEGKLSALLDGNCGLPQGSPLSPLLYTLFNAALLEAATLSSTAGVGFMDDVFVLGWGRTVEEAVRKLEGRVRKMEAWAEEVGVEFEPEKLAWVVFGGEKARKAAEGVKVRMGGVEVPRKRVVRFLGVPLDEGLALREFVDERVAAGEKALQGLRALSTATKGVSFPVARQLVVACVYPRLDYLAPVWWRMVGFVGAEARFAGVQRRAAQFVSGALRSTSLPALEVSSYLQPTSLRLERLAFRAAARHRTLPSHHPLASLLPTQQTEKTTHLSPLLRLARGFPALSTLSLERIDPLLALEPGTGATALPPISIAPSKELALLAHDAVLASAPDSAIVLYSDGSGLEGRAGASAVWRKRREEGEEGEGEWTFPARGMALGQYQSVYVAELVGVGLALSSLQSMLQARNDTSPLQAHLFLDNQSAASNSCSPFPSSGQHLRLANLETYRHLKTVFLHLHLTLHWVPGHADVAGNEAADKAAKTAALRPVDGEEGGQDGDSDDGVDEVSGAELPKSRSALRAAFDEGLPERWNALWQAKGVPGAALRRVDHHRPSPHILRLHQHLPRPVSSLLTQLRNSHSHLLADRFRARVASSDRCDCGGAETVAHFLLSCPLHATHRRELAKAVGPHYRNLPLLLTAPDAVPHTMAFVLATGRFSRYHTRYSPRETKRAAEGGGASQGGGGRTAKTTKQMGGVRGKRRAAGAGAKQQQKREWR
ncbi:hypothetical protein JCM6882_002302 [Rhodosporidiobolus microsporus]